MIRIFTGIFFYLFLFLSSNVYSQECVDSDGDGWGWNGVASCLVNTNTLTGCVDEDGDGWGWDGSGSCRVNQITNSRSIDYAGLCLDTSKDGWGWDGKKSCKVEYHRDTRYLGDWACGDYDSWTASSGNFSICIAKPVPEYISPCWDNRQLSQSKNPEWCNFTEVVYPSVKVTQALGGVWLDWRLAMPDTGYNDIGEIPFGKIEEIPFRKVAYNNYKPLDKYNVYRNGVLQGSTSSTIWFDSDVEHGAKSLYTIENVYRINDGLKVSQISTDVFVKPTNISIENEQEWRRYANSKELEDFIDEVDDIPTIIDHVMPTAQTVALGAMFDAIRKYQMMSPSGLTFGTAIKNQRFGALVGLVIGIGHTALTYDPTDSFAEITDAANDLLIDHGITLPNEFEALGFNHSSSNPNHVFQYELIDNLVSTWVNVPWMSLSDDQAMQELLISTIDEIGQIKKSIKNLAGLKYPGDYFTYMNGRQICNYFNEGSSIRLACGRVRSN